MNILFDFQAFEMQKYGGVSRLYTETLPLFNQVNYQIGIKESDNIHLDDMNKVYKVRPYHYTHDKLFSKKTFPGQRTLLNLGASILGHRNYCKDINKEWCISLLKKSNYDVFEPTFFDDYFLPYIKNHPFVIAVHDMIPELFPQYFQSCDFQIIKKAILCPLATHIHVPSTQTKSDLINILNIEPEKITVISRGTSTISLYNINPLFDFPYLLYVGARWAYKNFANFLCEFAKVVSDYPDIHLVCTGSPFNKEELSLIRKYKLDGLVHQYFATSDTLGSLYRNAIAFVYPSEYEGFGLPILEAYNCGCPVMLNNTSCFPEVAGDAAIYFEMKDGKSDFYEKFEYIFQLSREDRTNLINKGYERMKLYSWKETAKKMEDIYISLI